MAAANDEQLADFDFLRKKLASLRMTAGRGENLMSKTDPQGDFSGIRNPVLSKALRANL